MAKLTLRDIGEGDLGTVDAIFRAAVARAEAYSPQERAAWAGPAERANWSGILTGRKFAKMAWIDGSPVGFMVCGCDGHLDLAYVDPRYARAGVGTALLAAVEAWARAQGIEVLTTQASRIARPFFAKHGWTLLHAQFVLRQGIKIENFVMRRDLRARGLTLENEAISLD